MKLDLYQIDAFAEKSFTGNPAAVCPLDAWLADDVMQAIAAENNLSETAFFVATQTGFHIRWFTPTIEVNLCGHATLASAFVLFHCLGYEQDSIVFASKSGQLNVTKKAELLTMDFPAQPPVICEIPDAIRQAFSATPIECLKSEDYIVVFADEESVATAEPDLLALSQLDLRGVIITAKSSRYDFVARFFGPNVGIDEDPVTGSAYTQLAPYWTDKLGKTTMSAKQLSRRGGELLVEQKGERVSISGYAVKYLQGEINV